MSGDSVQKTIDNTMEAFERFQEATRFADEARSDILTGLAEGRSLDELLTIATDAIALLCDNQFFADQVRSLLLSYPAAQDSGDLAAT